MKISAYRRTNLKYEVRNLLTDAGSRGLTHIELMWCLDIFNKNEIKFAISRLNSVEHVGFYKKNQENFYFTK